MKIQHKMWFWTFLVLTVSSIANASQESVCRIENQLTGSINLGSGTLIDITDDAQFGFILTCAHLFSEGTGRVTVRFAGGTTHAATVLRVNREADLAALEITKPRLQPASVSLSTSATERFTACGFGPNGQFACVSGFGLGVTASSGSMNLRLRGSVRSGDSGGGVFDSRDRLVGVIWGTADGVTYASSGKPLEKFLQSTLGRRYESVVAPSTRNANSSWARNANCPDGRCPLVPRRPLQAPRLLKPSQSECPCDPRFQQEARSRLSALEKELARQAAKSASNAPSQPSSSIWRQLTNPRWASISGLVGVAFGGWLLHRRWHKRSKKSNTQEATAAAEESFPEKSTTESTDEVAIESAAPIERDDREARQLLRLSQLEGRDPLQDALAGRLALD
ncbi:MAG: serine protease, partial [Lacipirellulaceae bacterium]